MVRDREKTCWGRIKETFLGLTQNYSTVNSRVNVKEKRLPGVLSGHLAKPPVIGF